MQKRELRKKYKDLRKKNTENQIEKMSIAIAQNLLLLPIWDKEYYHIFLPITTQNEVKTEFILKILLEKNKKIVVSKSNFDTRILTHFLWSENIEIQKNEYQIPEPIGGVEISDKKIDVVFVPLLAFDKKGNRVGYGKGFYDIFLSKCKSDVVKIGLSFFESEEEITDTLISDIKMNYCVTPKKTYIYCEKE